MKYIILLLFFFAGEAKAQNVNTQGQLLYKDAMDSKLMVQPQAAIVQVLNWKQVTKTDPANANNWLNYYLWTDRDKAIGAAEKKILLSEITNNSETYIREKAQYFLLLYLQSGKKDSASINKAISLAGEETWLLPFAVQYCIIANNKTALAVYCKKLNDQQPISNALYQYHYNVLQSADNNATVYAKGLNDLVPMAILQNVYNIRKDIQLKYYDAKIEDTANTYLCLTIGRDIITSYNNASCTGLLVRLSSKPTFNELRTHVENDFDLDKITTILNSTFQENELYKNYLPCFITLYKYYKSTNDNRANKIKTLIDTIASLTGVKQQIKSSIQE